MRFFFYGTLLDAEVRRRVLGPYAQAMTLSSAMLRGWRRVYVRGRTYPVVAPDRSACVDGLLTDDVAGPAASLIRRFESDEYREVSLPVETPDRGPVTARLFVARDPALATARSWTFAEWHRLHRAAFMARW